MAECCHQLMMTMVTPREVNDAHLEMIANDNSALKHHVLNSTTERKCSAPA